VPHALLREQVDIAVVRIRHDHVFAKGGANAPIQRAAVAMLRNGDDPRTVGFGQCLRTVCAPIVRCATQIGSRLIKPSALLAQNRAHAKSKKQVGEINGRKALQVARRDGRRLHGTGTKFHRKEFIIEEQNSVVSSPPTKSRQFARALL
jgi:hypothetical protein